MNNSRNFGFLLKDTTRRYVDQFERRARAIGLTLLQCKVLVRLERNEGVSQTRLAVLAEIEPMAMVRILDHMERDGWLERRPDPADRRAWCLFLTVTARPLLDQIWRLVDLTVEETFCRISKADRNAFIDLLERIHDNLRALDRVSGDPIAVAPARSTPESKARVRTTSSRTR